MFDPKRLGMYLLRKLLRYVPLNIMALLAVVYILPYVGSGPVWGSFADATQPCHTHWWTNVLWVNNLYPVNYDDKCLPWTWFVPCYVQLSLLLPFLIAIYKFENKIVTAGIYGFIGVAALAATFALVYVEDLGATISARPVTGSAPGCGVDAAGQVIGTPTSSAPFITTSCGEAFFAKVFMNPLYHFSSFYLGMLLCLVYLRFKEERAAGTAEQDSLSSRFVEMLTHNAAPRYIVYFIGLVCLIGSVLWQTPFAGATNTAPMSQVHAAFYGTFAFPLFLAGLSMILLPALAGKAALFRFIYGS